MMRVNFKVITMAAAMAVLTGCASEQEERFDPRAMGNAQRNASRDHTPEPLKPLPTTLQSRYLPENRNNPNFPQEAPAVTPLAAEGKIVRLPLREITQRAVAGNLSVKVSGYAPAIEETRVTEAESRFDPEAFADLTFKAARGPSGSQFGTDNSDQWQASVGLRQLLPSGGQLELAVRPTRGHFTSVSTDINNNPFDVNNKYYTSQVELQLTQPLLRDFGLEVNRARIVINQNNQRISVLDFRKDLEEMLRNVEEVYWRQVQAQQNVAIAERLLQRTLDTAEIVSKRFGQDVTLEQVSNSITRVESSRAELIRARQRVKDLSDQLKNLMNDDEFPVAGGTLILPADAPLEQVVTFDLNDSVSTALLNRFELGQQQLRVDSATVALQVAKNNRLPQLNLVGSIGTNALGEDYWDAVQDNFDRDDQNISWSLGLQFVQKLGNREALAIYRRAQLQRQQALDQYRQQVDQVTTDVKIAQREVETSWQAMGQNRAARFAAAKALEVVQNQEALGTALDPRFVESKLNRQQELAQGERAEADAIATYNIAISRLESAKGTLLRFNNVVLDEKTR